MESNVMKAENVPIHVTIFKLTKENYLYWDTTIKMVIAGEDHIDYINGRQKQSSENDPAWRRWYFEDNQVKIWIINSVLSEIQLLILKKETTKEMWVILERMYGAKKKHITLSDRGREPLVTST